MIDRFEHLFIAPKDFDASLAFYRDVLGWSLLSSWGEPGGERGSVLSSGAFKVMIVERRASPREPTRNQSGARIRVHLDIHDIDARFGRMPKGNHVVFPPEATEQGTRWFVVTDPDGNQIAFEEPKGRG